MRIAPSGSLSGGDRSCWRWLRAVHDPHLLFLDAPDVRCSIRSSTTDVNVLYELDRGRQTIFVTTALPG